jgi:integrase
MSVYIPRFKDGRPKSPYYHFDFVLTPNGKLESERFCGSTGQKKKKAAEDVEDDLRKLAKLGKLNNLMTLAQACERYLEEKAPSVSKKKAPGIVETMEEHAKRMARKQQELCMATLLLFYGTETPLLAISPNRVSEAVTKFKNTELTREKKVDGILQRVPTGKFPAPGTVNRQVVGPMRRVLRRAKKHWEVPIDLDKFQWGGEDGVMLEEPEERNRELTGAEELRFWEHLHPDYHPICEMYIISGKRQSLWLLLPKRKDRIDLEQGKVKMRKLKKRREEWHWVDLTERELEIVNEAWAQDPDSYYLFNAASRSPRDKGARRPITVRMLYDAVSSACAAAKISDFRPHDFRHTFGSRAARKAGGNGKMLQTAMDHSSYRSTLRYINVTPEEVRDLRASVTVTKTLPPNVKPLKKSGSK